MAAGHRTPSRRSSSPTPTGRRRRPPSSGSRPRASRSPACTSRSRSPRHTTARSRWSRSRWAAARTTRPTGRSSTRRGAELAPAVFGGLPGGPGARSPAMRRSRSTSPRSTPTASRSIFGFVLGPVVPADARRLPLDRHPDQGDPAQPAVGGGGLRRPRPGLPGRLVGRTARDHAERRHRELGPAVHLHDPVRAVDGLPPVHPHPDQGGARPRASTRGRRSPRASR